MASYLELEANRNEYRDKIPTRDGCTATMQIALATLHDQQVAGGSCLAIAVLLPRSTLRSLVSRKMIDEKCRPTRKADDLLQKWWKEARREGK